MAELDKHLLRLRVAARAAILFERVWPEIWPALGVAGVFLCVALLDLPARLTPWRHIALLAIFIGLFLFLLARGLSRLVLPNLADADRRLERQSGLRHRPLAALTDRPAGNDPMAAAIWREHLARATGNLQKLRVGLPRPGLARRDPRALRVAVLVSLAAALTIAGRDAPARLAQAFSPSWPRMQSAPAVEIAAWITPPGYTRLPPFFLKPGGGAVRAPAGSRLTVSVTGGTMSPTLTLGGNDQKLPSLDRASFQGERELTESGLLRLTREGAPMAAWELSLIQDMPPSVGWTTTPGPTRHGEQLRLPWRAEDDYGVVAVTAELALRERPDLSPLPFQITLPTEANAKLRAVSVQDLSAHPWAGLAVRGRLVAKDAIGQTGESATVEFDLPQRRFQNPVARILVELRRGLSLHPEDRAAALEALDQLLLVPNVLGDDLASFLNLEGIYYELVRDHTVEAVPEAQGRMWELAVRLEDGQPERSAKALEAARQAVREALEQATQNPTAENRDALDRALKELEAAIQQHLEALMDQARRDGADERADPDAMRMDQRDMQRLTEAARDAAKAGKMAEAKKSLAELEAMLQQLREAEAAGNPAGSAQGAKRRAERRERGQKQIGAVQDMIGREGGLLDHSQGRANDSGSPSPVGPASAQDDAARLADSARLIDTARLADRRVQQALRRALGALMQQFGDLTGEIPASLSDADQAMRDAAKALTEGSDSAAGLAQQKTIEALQKGGNEMGQAVSRQFGPGQGGFGEGPGEGDGNGGGATANGRGDDDGSARARAGGPPGRGDGRDPLGRPQGQGMSGADESADVRLPEEQERQRAQAIQEELRRRGADRGRSQEELDYIDRLLRRF